MTNLFGLVLGEDWGDYPRPHTDEDDTCMCPDYKAMRRALESSPPDD